MTKKRMVEQLAFGTGMTKKDARRLLLDCGWDYDKAFTLWKAMQAIEKIDWDGICKTICNAFTELAGCIQKFMDEELPIFQEKIKNLNLDIGGENDETQKRTEEPDDVG